jgi:hypothetical protein
MCISFDAIGGTPFRFQTVLAQRYRSWDQDEMFTAHVLIALASDWFDDNDPRTTVIPLQRPDHIEADAKEWASDTFTKYDSDITAKKTLNEPSG